MQVHPDEHDRRDFQRLDEQVRNGIQTYLQVGYALLEIKHRQLYRENFATWEDYCRSRIGYTARRVDQMIAGWHTHRIIENARSENPDLPSPSSEFQIRPLTGHTPGKAVEAWQDATTIHGDKPSAREVREIVTGREAAERNGYQPQDTDTPPDQSTPPTLTRKQEQDEAYRRQVYGAGYSLITQWMNAGKLTPRQAWDVCVALVAVEPRVRGHMLKLQITNPALIHEMNRLFKRKSETYDEIVTTGFIQLPDGPVPADKALPSHLRALLDLKHEEHRRRAAAERDAAQKIEAQTFTLWTGPDDKVMQKNIAALESAIGADRLRRLCEQYLEAQVNV